jgi:hypothetical protein
MVDIIDENHPHWGLWVKNWKNAKTFFDTEGNLKTKCRLKKRWHDEFFKDLAELTRKSWSTTPHQIDARLVSGDSQRKS